MVIRRLCLLLAAALSLAAADPVLAINSGTSSYQVGDAAINLDAAALCSDADSPSSFDGGVLTVTVLNVVDGTGSPLVPDASDVIGVAVGDYTVGAGVWRISLSGALVRIAPVVGGVPGTTVTFGTWSGGAGGASLTIELTRESTVDATTAVLRALSFKNESGASAVIGTRTIGITLSDGTVGGNPASDTTKVKVVAPPQAPTANPVSVSTSEEQAVAGTMAGSDPDSAAIIYVLGPQPAQGTVSLTNAQTGEFLFTPAANFAGTTTFSYTVSDGSLTSAPALVTITVSPINDPPSFVSGGNITDISDGQLATVTGWASSITPGGGADEASQTVTFTVTTVTPAAFTRAPAIDSNGTLTYTAVAHYTGTVTLTIRARDDGGQTNGGIDASSAINITLTLDGSSVPPVVAPVTVSTLLGLNASVTPQFSASGGAVTFSALTACSLGQLAIEASTGVITLIPERAGTEVLTARASNGAGTTDFSITVSITDPAASAARPRIISAPSEEAVVIGNAWTYDLTVSSASIAPGSQLGGNVSGAPGATIVRTQANTFRVTVPTVVGDTHKRIHIVVYDLATYAADAQLVIVRAIPLGGGG